MNGKIILTLFILFYQKEEIKAKKLTKNEELLMNEDLIFYENEPKYKVKRQVNFNLEFGSGLSEEPTTLFGNTTFFSLTTDQTTLIVNPCDSNPCASNTTCLNLGDEYECECNEGFVYNNVQTSCQDIDECALNISNCGENEKCVNTIGSFKCICDDGYELVNNVCEQISTQAPSTEKKELETDLFETTEATTTPLPNSLILGPNDVSLNDSLIGNDKSYQFTSPDVSLNILGSSYDSFRVQPNGFVSFSGQAPNLIRDPPDSIENFNFPIIAPLWSNSIIDDQSDVKFGTYQGTDIDQNLLERIRGFLRRPRAKRSVSMEDYEPELIYSISWENLKESSTSNKRATFQLFITTSFSQEKSFAIFNYIKVEWNEIDQKIVFIGLSDGNNSITNPFTVNADVSGNPSLITSQPGNTGQNGVYVYELNFEDKETDEITIEPETTLSESTSSTSTIEETTLDETTDEKTVAPVVTETTLSTTTSSTSTIEETTFDEKTDEKTVAPIVTETTLSTTTSSTSTIEQTTLDETTDEKTVAPVVTETTLSTTTSSTSTLKTTIIPETTEEKTVLPLVSETTLSTTTSSTSTLKTTIIPETTEEQTVLPIVTETTLSTTTVITSISSTSPPSSTSIVTFTVDQTTEVTQILTEISTSTSTLSTTSTTTTSTTSSTSTTSTTTPIPIVPIFGPNDESLKTRSLISGVQSYQFFSSNVELNILGSTYNSFRIYPNGFVSFGSQAPIFIRNPTFSINNFNFPIIAPLWSNSVFDDQSDVKFGTYQGSNIDPTFLSSIRRILNPASASRAVSLDVYNPELIYSITWENLKESTTSDKRATFQLFITISFSQETSYAIFNYVKVDWTQSNQRFVFIGLTDGNRGRTNRFSFNGDASGNPSLITSQSGNTGQNGVFVYDLNYVVVDQCTRLLNQKILNRFQPATQELNFFMICPLTDFAMAFNPYFTEFRGRKWQNSKCYKLKWNSFYRYIIQQLCCYDTNSRNLIFFGRNSGFAYNAPAVEPIMSEGNQCCSGSNLNWNNCRRFYTLYPPTLLSLRQILFIFGWGGGDPHLTTFDDYSYTFNGLGKFVFSRAKDNSFQIQGLTSILANINGSSDLSGTLFTSFAMKTTRSQTFQIDLVDGDKARPYLSLHINKQEQTEADFSLNFAYQKDFACVDKSDELCTTIIQSEVGAQFLFDNGLSLTFSVTIVTVSQVETRSWITCSVNFLNNERFEYQGNLQGLMGNWNGDKTDDIIGRDGSTPQSLTDRQIYDTMVTWAVTSEEDLFTVNTISRTIGRIRGSRQSTYRPVFLEDLVIDPRINQSCNFKPQCIFDATASGLTQVGEQTLEGVRALETSITETRLSPPAVLFLNNKTELNWHSDQVVTISVQVTDTNSFVVELDTDNIEVQSADLGSGLSRTIDIEFKPRADQLPKIGLIAKDDTNLTTTIYYSQFFICKCQSLSVDNECKFDVVQESIENTGVFVACECDDYHEGIYCDKVRNECDTGRVCDKEGNFGQTCEPLSVEEQKATGRGYRCIGDCPSGYEKDEFGACRDILECSLEPAVCKDGSTCVEKPGSFECVCPTGYRYVNDLCEMIDYCKTEINKCDQICTPVVNGVECSCNPGFEYDQTANKCNAINVIGCDTFGCSQLCSSPSGTPQCFCENGYELDTDEKTCKDINECLNNNGNCPSGSTCQNTPGSFLCQCQVGTRLDLDTFRCIQCSEGFFGNNCSQTCQCTENFVRCDPKTGCICEPGFEGIDCQTEIDACEGFTNTQIQTCVSRFGERVFTCISGYELSDDGICTKIDYCDPNPCSDQANCTSLELNFTCTCQSGFEYNYETTDCDDIDECLIVQCPLNSQCNNLPGSYSCRCNSGFENENSDTKIPECVDINECEQGSFVCAPDRKCKNTIGDYECVCNDGFEEINEQCVQITTTQTTISTTTSIQTPQSTPIPNSLILGPNDVSLNDSLIGNDKSYQFTSPDVSLNILGSSYDSFRVQPNGFVSFSDQAPNLIQDPTGSIDNFKFPIIAPLWSNSIIDDQSDVKFGTYQGTDMDQNLLERIRGFLRRPRAKRSVSMEDYEPELIYSISWENLKESSTSDKRATFQLFITTSFSQKTSYAIFHYVKVDWTKLDRNIFIGLTDGVNSITNQFTANDDISGNPSLIASQPGNTGQNGVYVYRLNLEEVTTTTSTSSTVSTAVSQDNTGLILVIVLPIIAVLILSVIAGLICFCWYRKSNGSLPSRKKVPNIVEERAGVSGLNQRSMFEKKDVATEPDLINFDENAEVDRDGFEDGSSGSHSTYRPSYLFDKTDNVDVFKALEENARSSQKKTIGRPQSLFTGSSFSVPTAYHETTTPYGDFAGGRNRQEQGLSENDIKYFMNDEDTFDAFDNDDDLDEIIEAFNPNVKIPRPKIQLNPLKIFKFGNKNAESEN